MKEKNTFKIIFALLAVFLAVLPFLVSINDLLTRAVESIGWYGWLQDKIVPWEIGLVGIFARRLGIDFIAHPQGMSVNGIYAQLSWNCIGWQSLFFLIITFIFGLRGKYTFFSKTLVILIGILGTFWINILRMTLTVFLLVYSRRLFALVFHDYLAVIMTVIWLMLFWWFSYSFVLVKKRLQ